MLLIAKNRRARFDYEILEKVEAGLALVGTEVKSLRDRQVSFSDSYARIDNGEAHLFNLHIKPYAQATAAFNHDPLRKRKLLLHAREIRRLVGKLSERGLTLVPLAIYFSERGLAKVELGLGRGRKQHDKREAIRRRTADREMAREYPRGRRARREE